MTLNEAPIWWQPQHLLSRSVAESVTICLKNKKNAEVVNDRGKYHFMPRFTF